MESLFQGTNMTLDKLGSVIARNASAGGDAHFFDDSTTTPAKARQYLDSTKEADKIKGMKWVLAMLSRGKPVSEFFPCVVKNVAAHSVEVKKMVYMYLVHFADFDDTCREIALLSINSFQKDLSGGNQLIRGLALRVMTSIRVAEILQIQLLAVRKCATDSSPYVRKCAATALVKLFRHDAGQLESLTPVLTKLLEDGQPMVLGSAIAAFNDICPTSYSLLHSSYRTICKLLADLDEWSQVAALDVLGRYCRQHFSDPAPGMAAASRLQAKQRSSSAVVGQIRQTVKRRVVRKAFYSDEEDETVEEELEVCPGSVDDGTGKAGSNISTEGDDMDSDHRLLLRSSLPLLRSRNSAVVLGVATLHYYCGSQNTTTTEQLGKALVRILRNHREIQFMVLTAINTLAQERPGMFRAYLSDFFIKGTDPIFNRLLKLEILTAIFTREGGGSLAILRELQANIRHSDPRFVCGAVRAVGRIVDVDPSAAPDCMAGLMVLLRATKFSAVVDETVVVLRQMLQQNKDLPSTRLTLTQLVKILIASKDSSSSQETPLGDVGRSSIVWLLGECDSSGSDRAIAEVAPDVLRLLCQQFHAEGMETKMQILNLAVKIALRRPADESVQALARYVLEMCRYDADVDLRDRSRFMTAMLGLAMSSEESEDKSAATPIAVEHEALAELAEHSSGVMLSAKLPPVTLLGSVDVDGLPSFNLGSLSSTVGYAVPGYQRIPQWVSDPPSHSLRDAANASSVYFPAAVKSADNIGSMSGTGATIAGSAVDNFYGESSADDAGNGSSSDSDSTSTSDDDSGSESDSTSGGDSDSSSSNNTSSSDGGSSSENEVIAPRRMQAAKQVIASTQGNSGRDAVPTAKTNSSLLQGDYDAISDSMATLSKIKDGDLVSFLSGEARTGSLTSAPQAISTAFDDLLNLTDDVASRDSSTALKSIGDELRAFGTNVASTNSKPSPTGTAMGASILSAPMASLTILSTLNNLSNETVKVVETPQRPIMKAELCGGLSGTASLVYGGEAPAGSRIPFAHTLRFRFRNASEHPIRRIRLTYPSELHGLASPFPVVTQLLPNEDVQVPVSVVLTGQGGKTIQMAVTCDKGSFAAQFTPFEWEVLIPLQLSPHEFQSNRRLLGGFNEASAMFSAASLGLDSWTSRMELLELVAQRMRQRTDMAAIPGVKPSGNTFELYFAGMRRHGDKGEGSKVLITLAVGPAGEVQVRANCEDAVMSSSLLPILKN